MTDLMEEAYKGTILRHMDCMGCPVCIAGTLVLDGETLSCDYCGFKARIEITVESIGFED